MSRPDPYALLDFGQGRKLERFGNTCVDRPCVAAEGLDRQLPHLWNRARLTYQRQETERGHWRGQAPGEWNYSDGLLRLELRPTPAGQIGIFPEQRDNWTWIHQMCRRSASAQVLNLFAYTGAGTLAAAAGGGHVVHVDASRPVVSWARRNAQSSGLDHLPIRWIVEDAQKFVDRELRRHQRYQAVILDPPSYGHGRRGETWQLDRDLPRLLQKCIALLAGDARFLLLTCHTPDYDARRLAHMVEQTGPPSPGELCLLDMRLSTADGRQLPSGFGVRWTSQSGPYAEGKEIAG
jgi:23S rRNA (cytosine1962-C5)-methyltransferase